MYFKVPNSDQEHGSESDTSEFSVPSKGPEMTFLKYDRLTISISLFSKSCSRKRATIARNSLLNILLFTSDFEKVNVHIVY